MKVTILGCGSSAGVPNLMGYWGVCDPSDVKNRRRRSSILVQSNQESLLIDTSPDIREQILAIGSPLINAVLLTHAHNDHISGIDELRSISFYSQKKTPVYSDESTLEHIRRHYGYLCGADGVDQLLYPPVISLNPLQMKQYNVVGAFDVFPFEHDHGGGMKALSFRFGTWAYSTDIHQLSEDNYLDLKGIHLWIVDCIGLRNAPTHSHLQQTLGWIERVGPHKAILTHLGPQMDYEAITKILPENVTLAYDGMMLETIDV